MAISDNIKQLISEGKTQEALDELQTLLKERDPNLLNQTYLLEGQYKDLKKKLSLGLEDAANELNRINYTLLSICDEVSKIIPKDKEVNYKVESSPITTNDSLNPLVIFAIVAALGIGIIVLIIYFLK